MPREGKFWLCFPSSLVPRPPSRFYLHGCKIKCGWRPGNEATSLPPNGVMLVFSLNSFCLDTSYCSLVLHPSLLSLILTAALKCCKDPDVVGHYDALLAFADHKAEGFFTRHGFTDDPIISSRYRLGPLSYMYAISLM